MSVEPKSTENTGNVSAEDIEQAEKYKNEANDFFKSTYLQINSSIQSLYVPNSCLNA